MTRETMCGHSNLEKRGAVYYARIATPKALKEARALAGKTGKGEVWRSLRTKDRSEAKRLLRGVLDEIEAEFARELRALTAPVEVPPGKHIPNDSEIREAVRDEITRFRDSDERRRMRGLPAAALKADVALAKRNEKSALGRGEPTAAVERALANMCERNAFHLPAGSNEERIARHLIARGLVVHARNVAPSAAPCSRIPRGGSA
jgi:hypothetical protein